MLPPTPRRRMRKMSDQELKLSPSMMEFRKKVQAEAVRLGVSEREVIIELMDKVERVPLPDPPTEASDV